MHVIRSGRRASRLLADSPCHLHSIFSSSINLQTPRGLVHVSATASRVPFGCEVAPSDMARLRGLADGSGSLSAAKKAGRFVELHTDAATMVLDHVFDDVRTAVPPDGVARLRVRLNGTTMGLSGVLAGGFAPGAEPVRRAIAALANGEDVPALLWLVGRGPGLTPSGDDILVGALAMLTRLDLVNDAARARLRAVLTPDPAPTTDVSVAYLAAAIDGEFSDDIRGLVLGMWCENATGVDTALQALSLHGHTSGFDAALGVLLAAQIHLDQTNTPTGESWFPTS